MAQWLGQFSGHTHATLVEDREAALRHAVVAFREAVSGKVQDTKAKAVRNLAKRLLSARLRLFKARIAVAEPGSPEGEKQSDDTQGLRQREAKARAEGLLGILVEFGVQDAAV